MNQILITGDEYNNNQHNNNNNRNKPNKTKMPKTPKMPKEKNVLGINGIVIFYAICTIILGICMISGSAYARAMINETVLGSIKPTVDMIRNDNNNTVELTIKHIRGIKTVSYRWNAEEPVIINGNNSKEISETIDLLGGRNTLVVDITEENGETVTYRKEFTVGNIPEITLEAVANGVQVTVSSDDEIDYIVYSWDGGEEETIYVGETTYEGTITAPSGQHTLKIEATDVNSVTAVKEQVVVGDTEPILELGASIIDGKLVFTIDAEDDEEISTIQIEHNDGEPQVIEVNDTTYHGEIEMTQGMNKLIVLVTNINGLEAIQGVQFNNE